MSLTARSIPISAHSKASHLDQVIHPEELPNAMSELTESSSSQTKDVLKVRKVTRHEPQGLKQFPEFQTQRASRIVNSNPAVSTTTNWPVGFWWSELSQPYFRFTQLGFGVEIFRPRRWGVRFHAMSDPEDVSTVAGRRRDQPRGISTILISSLLVEKHEEEVDKIGSRRSSMRSSLLAARVLMFTMERATNLHKKVRRIL